MKISQNPLVIPDTVSGREALSEIITRNGSKKYICPNCQTEKIPSCDDGLEWVRCPIYDNQYICEGCCIDISSVAHDVSYKDNPFVSFLDEAATGSGKSNEEVHRICLIHQLEILKVMLQQDQLSQEWREVRLRQHSEILTLLKGGKFKLNS